MSALGLEAHLVDRADWHAVPAPLQRFCEREAGIPLALGWTDEDGWFILSNGQGPVLLWAEYADGWERLPGSH